MTPELIAILVVGVALAGLVLNGQRQITARLDRPEARLDRLEASYADLRERMARLEGSFEGFTQRRPDAAE